MVRQKITNETSTRRSYIKASLIGATGIGLAGCTGNGNGNGNGDDPLADFPSRNIDLTVPWGAGGGTDSMARAIGRELDDMLDVAAIRSL